MAYGRSVRQDHDEIIATRSSSVRQPYGPAQIFNLALGIFLVVVGAVALARTGLHSITKPTTTVGPFGLTPLYALVHIAMGVMALASATSRSAARGMGMFLGATMIAVGIVTIIQPVKAFGWRDANGVADLILGAGAIVAAAMTSLSEYGERRITTATETEREHVA